jgi:hypothetical protein
MSTMSTPTPAITVSACHGGAPDIGRDPTIKADTYQPQP